MTKVEMQSYQAGIDYERERILNILRKNVLSFENMRGYFNIFNEIIKYKKKKFNPYWLVAFIIMAIMGSLVYFGIVSHKLGGALLIFIGVIFYMYNIGEVK